MSLSATVRALVLAGATPEMILAVVETHERETADALARRRASDAARQQRHRDLKSMSVEASSRDVTLSVNDDRDSRDPSPHVGERAQVVTLTSSLRSEGTQEANASFVDAPSAKSTPADPEKPKTKPPKATRGTRLPEDWEPSADEFDLGRQAGLTDEEIHRAALEFRNYWCSRSRDATKLSWRLTWHNRVNEIGERKQRTSARMAASPSQSGGGGRGAVSFADLYARRHGTGAG